MAMRKPSVCMAWLVENPSLMFLQLGTPGEVSQAMPTRAGAVSGRVISFPERDAMSKSELLFTSRIK